jgi:bacillithiol system protein YtxJ
LGLFDSFKGWSNGPQISEKWNIPQSTAEIEAIFQDKKGYHLIYKHSFSCSICLFSLRSVESVLSDLPSQLTVHFIDVKTNRELSNLVAKLSGVRHESPQGLFIERGNVYWHDSHGGVRSEAILECISELQLN